MKSRNFLFRPAVLEVSPHAIEQHTLEPHLSWVVWSAQNLPGAVNRHAVLRLKYLLGRKGVFGGTWDIKSQPFTRRAEYTLIEDLYRSLPEFRQSLWYQQAMETIRRHGVFSHKTEIARDAAQLDALFGGYLVDLLETMRREGYRQREGADLPEAMIGRDGTLIKTAHGTHRLAAAKVTGATGLFPVRVIGAHRLWIASLAAREGYSGPRRMGQEVVARALAEIEARYR